jgi:ABC-2 type transport system ATP-binding protein
MSEDIVAVDHLVKNFGELRAVDDISFSVHRGEIFGFLGPNGAGKSTTIKVLTTLLRRTSGRAVIDGLDIDERPTEVRSMIGYASQSVGVDDDLTGRENLELQCRFYHIPRGEIAPRVQEVIRTVGLAEAADRRAGTYSGGMRKRLDLGTSLISRPKLLFLDEPTTGLDPQSRSVVWDYIRKLNRGGMTIFLTTQYMEEADHLADRLCIIDRGKIVAQGKPAELKAHIGADQIQLSFAEDAGPPSEKTIDRLRTMSGVKEVRDCENGVLCQSGLVVYAENGPALVPQLVRMLDEEGHRIERLTLSAPSLDDVFLKFTGRKLRVEEARSMPSRTPGRRRRG